MPQIDPKYLELLNRPAGQVTVLEVMQMLGVTPLIFQTPQWNTDFQTALAEAKKNNKVVFALFTGSTWCKYCKELEEEVLSTSTFLTWAHQKVILLKLDFPPFSTPLPSNHPYMELYQKYQISGYPTAVGLNDDESERGRLSGYSSGAGPQVWLTLFETNAKMNSFPIPTPSP